MNESKLPFGETSVSEAEVQSITEQQKAERILRQEYSVDDPHVEGFLTAIPDLLDWLEQEGRVLPWRETTDPWEVFVAEVMLQRTHAKAVLGVYPNFLERFPSPEELAKAEESTIREVVHGLGLVDNRVRTFQSIGETFSNGVPNSLEDLKEPWGVGEYSARACQLFARGEVHALVDTNFSRIINRIFDADLPDSPSETRSMYQLMDALTPQKPEIARAFNFAILDLGALVCTSRSPDCVVCPMNHTCMYYHNEGVNR